MGCIETILILVCGAIFLIGLHKEEMIRSIAYILFADCLLFLVISIFKEGR